MDGYRALAAGIIRQAVWDVKNLPNKDPDKIDAIEFFTNDWFEFIADVLNLDAGKIRKKVAELCQIQCQRRDSKKNKNIHLPSVIQKLEQGEEGRHIEAAQLAYVGVK